MPKTKVAKIVLGYNPKTLEGLAYSMSLVVYILGGMAAGAGLAALLKRPKLKWALYSGAAVALAFRLYLVANPPGFNGTEN